MNFPCKLAVDVDAAKFQIIRCGEEVNAKQIQDAKTCLFVFEMSSIFDRHSAEEIDFPLSQFEEQRIASYLSVGHRQRYIAVQNCIFYTLTQLGLNSHWKRMPDSGRPYLNCNDFNISIAHSESKLVLAISNGRALGVDIEAQANEINLGRLCSRYGRSLAKGAWLSAVQEWTFRESLIKALDISMAACLSGIQVEMPSSRVLVWSRQPIVGNWSVSWLDIDDEVICFLIEI